jgi:hypothetical protein
MLVIHGFVAPTTARKSNMTVAGRSRPNWEMAGRQGSFRARAMPDAVLSQGRAEREGGGGCPRGGGREAWDPLQLCTGCTAAVWANG